LAGVRVADFAFAWAGAYISTLLAYMGAEVIKIESRTKPDHTRRFSMTTGGVFDDLDRSMVFNDLNVNKLGVTIDLGKPDGVELAKRIVAVSDAAVENMRPGVMSRLGLGYEDLIQVKPDIVYLASCMRGGSGPECDYGGYAPNFAAVSGLSHVTGYADDLPASFMGEVDLMSAFAAAFALLAALNHRQTTGEGQYIDVSSSDAISVLLGDVLLDYTMNGRLQHRRGNDDDFMAPHNCYRCRGEDDWVSIAVAADEEWNAFTIALGSPGWAMESRFADALSRWSNREELDRLVEVWSLSLTSREVMELLQPVGVAAIPSFSSEDLYGDPHLSEREVWVEVQHPAIGRQTLVAPPWKLSATPARVHSAAPLLGEDNQYVFGDLLGLPAVDIARLVEEEVIY
jgi:benzylsuccinate CoA-transferase BbsF subunit